MSPLKADRMTKKALSTGIPGSDQIRFFVQRFKHRFSFWKSQDLRPFVQQPWFYSNHWFSHHGGHCLDNIFTNDLESYQSIGISAPIESLHCMTWVTLSKLVMKPPKESFRVVDWEAADCLKPKYLSFRILMVAVPENWWKLLPLPLQWTKRHTFLHALFNLRRWKPCPIAQQWSMFGCAEQAAHGCPKNFSGRFNVNIEHTENFDGINRQSIDQLWFTLGKLPRLPAVLQRLTTSEHVWTDEGHQIFLVHHL